MLGRKKDLGILWVQGDPAEVVLDVSNPIACELKMEKMVSILYIIYYRRHLYWHVPKNVFIICTYTVAMASSHPFIQLLGTLLPY